MIDTLLAATAIEHDVCLVTRNTRDVQHSGANLFNPWEHRPSRRMWYLIGCMCALPPQSQRHLAVPDIHPDAISTAIPVRLHTSGHSPQIAIPSTVA